MKNIFFAIILLLVSVAAFGQSSGKASLLFTNCAANEDACRTNELYRYNFENGRYVGKELVISSKTDDVNFGHGGNQVYQNRYALTRWGDIIDVKAKKILHVGEGDLFRTDGSKIFVTVYREGRPEGLYAYDLSTGKYAIVRKTDRSMFFGKLSPNGLRSAEVACTGKSVKEIKCGLHVVEANGAKRVFEGKFEVQRVPDPQSSSFNKTPVIWIDEELILTQKNNGELVTVDLSGKVTPLMNIKIEELPYHNPEFYRDMLGNIVYDMGGNNYIIDIKNKTFKTKPYGSEFGYFHSELENDLKTFHEKKGEVGEFNLGGGVYTKDYWAVIYTGKGQNLGAPKGLKVYSKQTKEWTTIEIPRASEFVGWIEE